MKLRNQSCQLILGHYTIYAYSFHTKRLKLFFQGSEFYSQALGNKIPKGGILVPSAREYLERLYN